jgi:hypothetical protein
MTKLDLRAHHRQLDRILEANPEITSGSGAYLHIRAVRGAKNSDGTWQHEYRLEVVHPFNEEQEEEN